MHRNVIVKLVLFVGLGVSVLIATRANPAPGAPVAEARCASESPSGQSTSGYNGWGRTLMNTGDWSIDDVLEVGDNRIMLVGCYNPTDDGFVMMLGSNPGKTGDAAASEMIFQVANKDELVHRAAKTRDGGYVLLGLSSDSFYNGHRGDVVLVKLDSNMNIKWKYLYKTDNQLMPYQIFENDDGTYFVVCLNDVSRCVVMRIDATGKVLSSTSFDHIISPFGGFSSVKCPDGGLLVGGNVYYGDLPDVLLFKLDTTGRVEWARTYQNDGTDETYAVMNTKDGNFAFAGDTNSYGATLDAWLVKTDTTGDPIWQYRYKGSQDTSVYSAIATEDGGFLIAGSPDAYGDSKYIKLTAEGKLQWQRSYTDICERPIISCQAGGSFYVHELSAGYEKYYGWDSYWKLDANGYLSSDCRSGQWKLQTKKTKVTLSDRTITSARVKVRRYNYNPKIRTPVIAYYDFCG